MKTEEIMNSDILDIIFDGRNKEYGAYQLRKNEANRTIKAISVTFVMCILFFIATLITKSKAEVVPLYVTGEVSLVDLPDLLEKHKKIEIPKEEIKHQTVKVKVTQFTPPLIVEDDKVTEVLPEIKSLEDTKIGTKTISGDPDNGTVTVIVENKSSSSGVSIPVEEDYNKVFTVVQIPAEYPGGFAAWSRYLERNLNSNVPVDNGAPSGIYKVVVTFVIDKNGNISEINAENDPGYGTKEEAVRVLKKGGVWKPAVQNGRNVIYRHRQTISFRVDEE